MLHRRWFIIVIAPILLAGLGRSSDPAADAALIKRLLGNSDPAALITFLQSQVLTDAARGDYAKLIEQMGDKKFAARQEASRKLVEAGPVVLPMLREAMANPSKEIANRAARAVEDIERGPRADLPMAAVRQLVASRHDKTVETLLALVEAGHTDRFRDEILTGLRIVGASGAQVHPKLLEALSDSKAERRALAVQILVSTTDRTLRAKLRERLKDPDATVRYHTAVGLLPTGDRDTIPVLIDLIGSAPSAAIWQHTEELLYEVGGELAPDFEVGAGSAEDRKRLAQGWGEWWKARGAQVLLGRADDYPTDVAVVTDTKGRVWEFRPEGKPRYDINEGLASPVDARSLPGRRVLVADEGASKVIEFSHKGKVLWERAFDDGPVSVQRLPNGNTFVATYTTFWEVRRDGTVAFSRPAGHHGRISDANKMPDGRIVCLFSNNELVFFARDGQVLSQTKMESWGGVDVQPNGNVVVSLIQANKIVEVNGAGQILWQVALPGAWVGTRLPDGTTLIGSKKEQKMFRVDAKGKVLWEKQVDGHPHAMHWR